MGAIVSTLAFPNPPREYSESLLRQHEGLVWIKTASGLQIPAVHLYPQSYVSNKRQPKQQQQQRPTILYSHGNAEDLGIILPYLQTMANTLQCPVLGYEYPGYSLAQGKHASESLCYEAIQAAYEYLTTSSHCACRQVVAFGRSLGSGPTVHLCAQNPDHVVGCILQSPLSSAIRCVLDSCTATSLSFLDIFDNQGKIAQIRTPVFILHGTADTVVPCAHGKDLYAALQQDRHPGLDYPPLWIGGRGHNDMPERFCLAHCRDFITWLGD